MFHDRTDCKWSLLFSDQDYNGYRVHAQKVGVRLEIRGLDPDILQNALNLVLHDPQ
jgi:UDP:flavonoid glycosyltransferase YjiC (YdhE family)